jgi:hypothetical protein
MKPSQWNGISKSSMYGLFVHKLLRFMVFSWNQEITFHGANCSLYHLKETLLDIFALLLFIIFSIFQIHYHILSHFSLFSLFVPIPHDHSLRGRCSLSSALLLVSASPVPAIISVNIEYTKKCFGSKLFHFMEET